MINKIICKILIFLIPKSILHKKVKVILKNDTLKIIIRRKGMSIDKFKESVEPIINYFK